MAIEKLINIFVKFRTNMQDFSRVMRMPMPAMKKFNDGFDRVDKTMTKNVSTMGRFALNTRRLTHGFRGFKMEMLGVMFFGMMITRFFKGLIQPALNMTGAMKLLTIALGIMFLPIGMLMLGWVMALLSWWQSLNPETQKAINWFVLLGLAVGAIIGTIGQFTLGIGSLIIASAALNVSLFSIIGAVALLGAGIFSIFYLYDQWNEMTTGMKIAIVGITAALLVIAAPFSVLFSSILAVILAGQLFVSAMRLWENGGQELSILLFIAATMIASMIAPIMGTVALIAIVIWAYKNWGEVLSYFTNMTDGARIATGAMLLVLAAAITTVAILTGQFWMLPAATAAAAGGIVALGAKSFEATHKAKEEQKELNNAYSELESAYGGSFTTATDQINVLGESTAIATEQHNNLGFGVSQVTSKLAGEAKQVQVVNQFLKDYKLDTQNASESISLQAGKVDLLSDAFSVEMQKIGLDIDEKGRLIAINNGVASSYDGIFNSITKLYGTSGFAKPSSYQGPSTSDTSKHIVGSGSTEDPYRSVTKGKFEVNDFISRPGQPLTSFNPSDTIVGFKGGGGALGGVTFSPTINITANSNVDIDTLKSQLSAEWRDDLENMMRTR